MNRLHFSPLGLLLTSVVALVPVSWPVAADVLTTGLAVPDDCYTPIPGGWQIRLRADEFYTNIKDRNRTRTRDGISVPTIDSNTGRLTPNAPIGLLLDNPRQHCRPLFPPAEKSQLWTAEEQERTQRVSFRPVILAGIEPRFLLDGHAAGGILGRLHLGLTWPDGKSVWLHDWPEIVCRYVDGRLEYDLDGIVRMRLAASTLAGAVGLIVKIEVEHAPKGAELVWSYGGASAFYTNESLRTSKLEYAPSQCARNDYTVRGATFGLERGFDQSDGIVSGDGQSVGIMRELPKFKAHIQGGSSWRGKIGLAPPEAFAASPAELLEASSFDRASGSNCVAVERVPLQPGQTGGFVVTGMGGNIEAAIADPATAWKEALARNASIAHRIITRTPDAYLDAAMTTLAFGNEGLWASQAYLHGAWSWRNAYLGWRSLYGPTVYGWTDRVRRSILNRCRLSVIKDGPDAGGIASMLEGMGFYYNMDEVFFDMVRHYWDYTSDVELMKEAFPVLEGAIDRENGRLRPAGGVLYESALNTWISDSHWYIQSQCTQASAYMLRAYEFMAEVAPRLGRDAQPFRDQADRIRQALQAVLWQERLGVFAECLDTRGNRLLHGEPELATIYHSAEFGAADPLQIYQMLHWADTHLRQERTPGGGRLYWSANWYPNHGLSYTHSTYEMAYAEELNFAETNFLAGRSDVGYALIRGCLSGVFSGDMPGGLSCHAHTDGTQRMNWEFADSVSMWGRTVVEGLFGIRVHRPRQLVELTPQIPAEWPKAGIETPHFSYTFERSPGRVLIRWTSPVETAVKLRLPLRVAEVPNVVVDGRNLACRLSAGVGFTWLESDISAASGGEILVVYSPAEVGTATKLKARQGESLRVATPAAPITRFRDPQGLLDDAVIKDGALTGKIHSQAVPGLLLVSNGNSDASCWLPVAVDVTPAQPADKPRWSPPDTVGQQDLGRWTLIDLGGVFNSGVAEAPQRMVAGAVPPPPPASQIGFDYWKEHVVHRCKPPCDAAWRAKVDAEGVAWTTDGIPFRTRREGNNIAVAALHTGAFPSTISFPVRAAGQALYLMISGETWPAQSHVVNLRITLRYADGNTEQHDLTQPFEIGNCWGQWCGLYHDTPANGFENIGGRSGPAGTSKVADPAKPIAVDTIAHLLRFDLALGKTLDQVDMEVIANDVIFGVMGASILKP